VKTFGFHGCMRTRHVIHDVRRLLPFPVRKGLPMPREPA